MEKFIDKKRLSYLDSYTMLSELSQQENIYFEPEGKNIFLLNRDNKESLFLKLPPLFPAPGTSEPLKDYMKKVSKYLLHIFYTWCRQEQQHLDVLKKAK